MGRGDANPLRGELASCEIDGRSFYAAAANVDAEHGRAAYRFFAHAGEPSDIRPLRGVPDVVLYRSNAVQTSTSLISDTESISRSSANNSSSCSCSAVIMRPYGPRLRATSTPIRSSASLKSLDVSGSM